MVYFDDFMCQFFACSMQNTVDFSEGDEFAGQYHTLLVSAKCLQYYEVRLVLGVSFDITHSLQVRRVEWGVRAFVCLRGCHAAPLTPNSSPPLAGGHLYVFVFGFVGCGCFQIVRKMCPFDTGGRRGVVLAAFVFVKGVSPYLL